MQKPVCCAMPCVPKLLQVSLQNRFVLSKGQTLQQSPAGLLQLLSTHKHCELPPALATHQNVCAGSSQSNPGCKGEMDFLQTYPFELRRSNLVLIENLWLSHFDTT